MVEALGFRGWVYDSLEAIRAFRIMCPYRGASYEKNGRQLWTSGGAETA